MGSWAGKKLNRAPMFSLLRNSSSEVIKTMDYLIIVGWMISLIFYSICITRSQYWWNGISEHRSNAFFHPNVLLSALGVLLAYREEVIFRFGTQQYLESRLYSRWRPWAVILLVATAWSFSHWGQENRTWIKVAQVFPFGVFLGILQKKFNFCLCFFAHSLFNVSAINFF